MDKLNIPKKLKVGFQERHDTYNGKLAYVVYVDEKGVLRKEKSWRGWIDAKIPIEEPDNVPMAGFVLNRDVGGVRNSYGWDARIEKVRVYDPRGFEFEISIPNLLFILQECSAIKGKGLEGEFVYAWSGSELVLLPVSSKEYGSSVEFTSLKKEKVSKKDLVPGCVYLTKDMEQEMYIGSFVIWGKTSGYTSVEGERKYIFVNMKKTEDEVDFDITGYRNCYKFIMLNDTKHVAKAVTNTPDADMFSRLYAEFNSICVKKNVLLGNPTTLEYSPLAEDKKLKTFCRMVTAAGYYYRGYNSDKYAKTLYLDLEHVTYQCLVSDIGAMESNRRGHYYGVNLSDEERRNVNMGKPFKIKVKGTLKVAAVGIDIKKSETMTDKILYLSKDELSAIMMDVDAVLESGKRVNLIDLQKE